MNPFRYGKVVTTPYFTGREKEIKEISETLKSGNNVLLLGPRRYGKTSLVREIFKKINSKNSIFLDFYSITSQKDFINRYAESVFKTQKIPIKKLLNKISGLMKNITPTLSFDSSGNPTWSLNYSENVVLEESLLDVLDLPQKIIDKNERFYVAFDEFQEIHKLNGEGFEKQLRASIQYHENVSYIFLGSKTHLLLDMFSSKARALYKSSKLINLQKIDAEKMQEFVISRFQTSNFHITDSMAEQIITITQNVPYYVQYLAAQVWQLMNILPEDDPDYLMKTAMKVF